MTQLTAQDVSTERLDDLAQIIAAYNQVTENLRRSHESLREEVVRLQGELASTDAQLQRSRRLAALGEMAAGIAHEIRNPLAAIQLYATVLREDLAGNPLEQTARKIAVAVKGLDAIVNDVLSFAREIEPRRRRMQAYELFVRAIDAVGPAVQERDVKVEIEESEVSLHGDPDLLHQVMLNLVRNAIEAMGDSGGRLSLAAFVDADAPGVTVLAVRDSGPGIEKESIDRIFNPFFTTRNTGTGLGLAIVHRIVDAHGGAITVRNDTTREFGGGAIFEIRLPTPKE